MQKIIESSSNYLLWVGMVAVLIMFGVNLADVVGAKFFERPLLGATELVSFFQVVAIACAVTGAFLARRHVKVEFFVEKLHGKCRGCVTKIMRFLELVFTAVIVYEGLRFAYNLKVASEKGVASNLPLYPFAFVFAGAFCIVCLYFVWELTKGNEVK